MKIGGSILSKICACCKIEKDTEHFSRKSVNKDGLYSYCKQCKKDQDKVYYSLNRDKVIMSVKVRSETIKEHIKEYMKTYREKNHERLNSQQNTFRLDNPSNALYRAAKYRAKFRGVEFNIELSDVVIPEFCPILHILLSVSSGKVSEYSPSLDRIDSTKGYIKGNVQVISYKANTMKSNANAEDLLLFASWVFENYLEDKYE